jgi:hypothetical protein
MNQCDSWHVTGTYRILEHEQELQANSCDRNCLTEDKREAAISGRVRMSLPDTLYYLLKKKHHYTRSYERKLICIF